MKPKHQSASQTSYNRAIALYGGKMIQRSRQLVYLTFMLLLALVALPALADEQTVPAEGSKAPAFKLPTQEGSTASLGQFKGKWVVLYFYPKDMTAGCTVEAH